MSDLIERLRNVAGKYDEYGVYSKLVIEAADEIEHMNNLTIMLKERDAEIERLRAALGRVIKAYEDNGESPFAIAREALK
jgi:hypothetical protein